MIRAYGSTPSALLAGTTLRISVRDLRTGRRSDPPPTELDTDTCTPTEVPEGEDDGCAVDPRPPNHLRIAVQLRGPGQYMVHLEATGTDGTFTATRCYTVVGMTESDVLLVGPVLEDQDADADGWTATETCREIDLADTGCKDQCPDQWGLDCNDGDPTINPSAVELCEDGIDQDCIGGDITCADNDADTYNGCPPDPPNCCDPDDDPECDPETQPRCVDRSTCDCDDTNAAVNPGINESSNPADGLCDNGVDEDCDGEQQRCDDDGDGVIECAAGETGGSCDCNDDNPAIYPGAPETPGDVCDGLDNNCNELIDEVEQCLSDDLDGDGSKVDDDCNDCAASMSPLEETAICEDDIDEQCALGGTNDGRRMPPGSDPCQNGDDDGDGYVSQAAGGTDCDDADPERHPGAPDDCRDGVDGDCSGTPSSCNTDGDDDGYNADNDCDDANPQVHPGLGVDDPCDGVDNDCNGVVDEDVPEGFGCILSQGEWTEIDFQTDLQHCGYCRHNCNPGCQDGTLCIADGCTGGACECGGGRECGGTNADYCCPDGCQDLTSDILNCGRCGQICEAPACQVPVCDDGVCGTDFMADGTPCGGGNFCCDGECRGECAPGSVSSQGCGDCGTQDRTCDAECTWGPYGACHSEGVCSIGNVETQACGNCGDQDRICQGDCRWSDYGVCYGQGSCAPGSTSQQGCGNCGSQSRTCRDDCSWGGYGACTGEGACTPGANESRACGNCGTQTRTCQGNCTWGSWGACGGEGVCAPGTNSSRGCGNCGTQSRTCNASCQWGAYGACGGEGVCTPGAVDSQSCGNCGTQSRTCSAACAWGSFGACGGEGPCSPGQVATQGCGNCGSQSRTCNASCQWPGWGACGGEGPCAPGAGQEVACNDCGNQHQTCDAGCQWVDQGSCDNTPPRSCDDGDVCTSDVCGGTGNCTNTGCGGGTPECCTLGCRECCVAADCPNPPTCRDATCSGGGAGGSCGLVNETDGTDPENECAGADVCCSGACQECCTDAQCGGGTPNCCNNNCEECCNAGDCPSGLCRDATCSSNSCGITFETAGTDPENECTGTDCCNGAGACVAGSC